MKNDKILEEWNEQFSNIDKLKIAEVKDLYKKIDETDNPELKKNYYDKIILGTQYVVYDYLKSTGLYLLSGVEISAEDIISTSYETWIECIKNGDLREAKFFSNVTNDHHFDYSIEKKLGISDRFEVCDKPTFYKNRRSFSETMLGALKNSHLKDAFVRYYRTEEDGYDDLNKTEEILKKYDISDNQKENIIILFEKVGKYLKSKIGSNKISDTNLKRYIKLIINNTINQDFISEFDLTDDSELISKIIEKETREEVITSFEKAKLSRLEEYIIKNRYGFYDGKVETYAKISGEVERSVDRVRQSEIKSLRKLRRQSVIKSLKSTL